MAWFPSPAASPVSMPSPSLVNFKNRSARSEADSARTRAGRELLDLHRRLVERVLVTLRGELAGDGVLGLLRERHDPVEDDRLAGRRRRGHEEGDVPARRVPEPAYRVVRAQGLQHAIDEDVEVSGFQDGEVVRERAGHAVAGVADLGLGIQYRH
jgi:hypothetical protein